MKAVIDRYAKAKEEQLGVNNATSEIMKKKCPQNKQLHSKSSIHTPKHKLWQREAASLRQQLHNLQESHKQLMGEELSGLGVRDLQSLENRLEMNLRNVRTRKDYLLKSEIEELHRKGGLIHQENMELCRRVNIMSQQKIELHRKLQASEQRGIVDANKSPGTSYSFGVAQDADVLANPELSQSPHKEGAQREPGAPELGINGVTDWSRGSLVHM
ncbi:hypothetical protein EJB05_19869, partial [Eragrostis curvula]